MENIPGQGDRVNLEQSESTGVAGQLHPPPALLLSICLGCLVTRYYTSRSQTLCERTQRLPAISTY